MVQCGPAWTLYRAQVIIVHYQWEFYRILQLVDIYVKEAEVYHILEDSG